MVQSHRRGESVSLFTHLVVREDSLTLFGFQDLEELSLFQELIKVNGVGPRLALETLSTHKPEVIKRAVLNKQEEIFRPGFRYWKKDRSEDIIIP